MRYGFTTGSCAAAAAKAAAYMLLTGIKKNEIKIKTPKGIEYIAAIHDLRKGEGEVSCAVMKDGGDDPDVTTGCLIYASVAIKKQNPAKDEKQSVVINVDGGKGVGRVTKPGLDQPVGAAAINHVPREMIDNEVREICEAIDFNGELDVVISVPDGEEIAKKTFNEKLGIIGGISIIGTSGIVEPMSSQALLDTIRTFLNQRRAQGYDYVAISPGNYGTDYMLKTYGYDLDKSIKCSNFIGDTIDMAAELGFKGVLLTGHIGKLVKVSGGMMNTHSKEGDCRMELIAAAGIKAEVSQDALKKVLDCVATEEALRLIESENKLDIVMKYIMEKVMYYLNKRAGDALDMECIIYSNELGELAKSEGADKWLTLLVREQEQ